MGATVILSAFLVLSVIANTCVHLLHIRFFVYSYLSQHSVGRLAMEGRGMPRLQHVHLNDDSEVTSAQGPTI